MNLNFYNQFIIIDFFILDICSIECLLEWICPYLEPNKLWLVTLLIYYLYINHLDC